MTQTLLQDAVDALERVAVARGWTPDADTKAIWALIIAALMDGNQLVVVVPVDGAVDALRLYASALATQGARALANPNLDRPDPDDNPTIESESP